MVASVFVTLADTAPGLAVAMRTAPDAGARIENSVECDLACAVQFAVVRETRHRRHQGRDPTGFTDRSLICRALVRETAKRVAAFGLHVAPLWEAHHGARHRLDPAGSRDHGLIDRIGIHQAL